MSSRDYATIALQYAADVVSGKIDACQLVKYSCQRQLDDLDKQDTDSFPYVFNPWLVGSNGVEYQPANRICKFAENLHHVKGEWKGKLIVLEPWQIFFLTTIFGWVNEKTGLRRFREVYAEIPRKNGKSVLGWIIGLFMFCADSEGGSEIFSGATTQKQALEVFKPAWQQAKGNSDFREYYGITVYGNKPDMGSLILEGDYSKFETLIGDPGDGASPHCAIVDEYHEHKDPGLYDTMRTGMGARRQPILLVITTSGSNFTSPCKEKRDQVVDILKNIFENDRLFGIIYTIDQNDDWQDLNNWKKANPNYGISVYSDYLSDQLKEAQQNTSKQNIIRCKHLNQWMTSNNAWMDMDKWRASGNSNLLESDFLNRACYMGIDLAVKIDINAKIKIYIGEDNKKYMFCEFYLPEGTALDPKKTHYLKWMNDGRLLTNPGPVIDFEKIENDIFEDIMSGNVNEVCFDPYQATQMTSHLIDRLNVSRSRKEINTILIEVNQTVLRLSEPMKELQKAVYEGSLIHDNCPIMDWMMSNVVAHYDAKENIYPRKENEASKIDGPVGAIMAMSRAMLHKDIDGGNDGSLL